MMTNMAAGMENEVLSHAHTLATANAASERAVATLAAVVQALKP
jgi:purine-nucleoside phosphorylase